MGGRPVLLQRFPDGAGGHVVLPEAGRRQGAPDWLQTTVVSTPNGTTSNALVAADLAHVLWAVNLGCLGFHVWPTTAADPEHADELRIDLDPQPGRRLRRWSGRRAAEVKALLDELGVVGLPEDHRQPRASTSTSGSSRGGTATRCGPPPSPWPASWSGAGPTCITAAWWKEERGERVFVDFNQNAPHKTVFGAWSVRARAGGAGVDAVRAGTSSTTIHPDELTHRHRARPRRRARRPVGGHDDDPQSLEPLLALHERDMAAGLLDAPWPPVYPKMPERAAAGGAEPGPQATVTRYERTTVSEAERTSDPGGRPLAVVPAQSDHGMKYIGFGSLTVCSAWPPSRSLNWSPMLTTIVTS